MIADTSRRGAKIRRAYDSLIGRLPSTYPHATLIVHENLHDLRKRYWRGSAESRNAADYEPFAFCDGERNTIHVPLNLAKETYQQILWYILHEVGHLYALEKYGWRDRRWSNNMTAEKYADRFADRWTNRLKAEGFYSKIQ